MPFQDGFEALYLCCGNMHHGNVVSNSDPGSFDGAPLLPASRPARASPTSRPHPFPVLWLFQSLASVLAGSFSAYALFFPPLLCPPRDPSSASGGFTVRPPPPSKCTPTSLLVLPSSFAVSSRSPGLRPPPALFCITIRKRPAVFRSGCPRG